MSPQQQVEIVRYGLPNKWDQAPYGTRCRVIIDGDREDIYIQVNVDEENPKWEPIGISQK